MRSKITILLAVLLAGCSHSKNPPAKAAGVFKNKDGVHVLTPNGQLYESKTNIAGDKLYYIGSVSSKNDLPTELFVTTSSNKITDWMGATLIFNQDFSTFDAFDYEPRKSRDKPTKPPRSSFERVY